MKLNVGYENKMTVQTANIKLRKGNTSENPDP